MSNQLIQNKTLEDALKECNSNLTINDYNNLEVGDYMLTKSSSYAPFIQIQSINVESYDRSKDKDGSDVVKWIEVKYKRLLIDYDNLDVSEEEPGKIDKMKLSEITCDRTFKTKQDLIDYIKLANQAISGTLQFEEKEEISSSTALAVASSKATLESLQNVVENKHLHLTKIRDLVALKLKQEEDKLRSIRWGLEKQMEVFMKQIKVIMKTIQSIELYLGIHEDLFQIQEGEAASIDEPLSFRQMILFMDEEVADTVDQGWDFKDIEKFDKWLIENERFKTLVPEQKCVVIFKPRRHAKHYSSNAYENAQLNAYNKTTYVLIRNGDNLYRIYSENLNVHGKLFPKKNELSDIFDRLNAEQSEFMKQDIQKNADEVIDQYTRQSLLLQGLIDRSEVFYPLKRQGMSLFKLEEFSDCFNFVYDADDLLPTGRLSFRSWQKFINSKLQYGSRVIIAGAEKPSLKHYNDSENRYVRRYENTYAMPDPPKDGVYVTHPWKEEIVDWLNSEEQADDKISKLKERSDVDQSTIEKTFYNQRWIVKYTKTILSVLYTDKSRWWYDDNDEKKRNRKRYKIYEDDGFVLNYDQISLDDIDFYLTNRTDRHNYLSMMPVLRTIKATRLKELESEKLFVQLIQQRTGRNETYIWLAVEWWKTKNQWKRPIAKDDAKALRMIESKLRRMKV